MILMGVKMNETDSEKWHARIRQLEKKAHVLLTLGNLLGVVAIVMIVVLFVKYDLQPFFEKSLLIATPVLIYNLYVKKIVSKCDSEIMQLRQRIKLSEGSS